jgi:pimeloyl-ACP methyl ester carboxylesterase
MALSSNGLEATKHRTKTVDGQRVFYREAGDPSKQTIVLLHGFPSSSHMFRDLIPKLAGDFHVIAPDMIGFGYSSAPPKTEFDYTFDHLTQITRELLDQLGIKDYLLYLHDYGGPIGFRLAQQSPAKVKGLVIQNANAYMEGVGAPVADVFLPLWKEQTAETIGAARRFFKPETTRFLYTEGARNPELLSPDAWTLDQGMLDRKDNDEIQLALFVDYQSNVARYDQWQRYFREHQPKTLIVWGKNDPLFVAPGAEAFKRDVPNAKLHWLDAGHFALEEASSEVAAEIVRFFK